MKSLASFKGIYTATISPLDKKGNINLQMQEKIIDFHKKNGIKGLYLCGSTGEAPLLDSRERMALAGNAIKCAKGMKTIVHTGHVSTAQALELSKAAYNDGADAISSVKPYYYNFSEEIEYNYYRDLSSSVPLPFFIYVNTFSSKNEISLKHTLRLFKLKNVVGIKYTGVDFYTMRYISDQIPKKHLVLSGSDQRMIMGLSFGTCGAIGSFQNVIPAAFVKLWAMFNQGESEKACDLQQRINALIRMYEPLGDISYIKAMMRYIGFDCGNARKPFAQLTEKQYSRFARKLEQFDELFALNRY